MPSLISILGDTRACPHRPHVRSLATLVNTTSLGMRGAPPLIIDLSALDSAALVSDIVYTPLETELLGQARARGNPTVDGLGMERPELHNKPMQER